MAAVQSGGRGGRALRGPLLCTVAGVQREVSLAREGSTPALHALGKGTRAWGSGGGWGGVLEEMGEEGVGVFITN